MMYNNSLELLLDRKVPICVVGLGYVGLPLAVALSNRFNVIGFDVNSTRVESLIGGVDITGEVESASLTSENLQFTSDPESLGDAKFII
ncbi:hypothetical protein MNBD_NITROSPINAE03-423, partial [hydrothermal vent metagenome]